DSTTAYQGFGRQIDLNFIHKLHKFVTQGVTPNLTFLIDLEPELTLKRKSLSKEKMDRLDRENLVFQQRVRAGYLEIARSESQRFIIIDGSQAVNTIQEQIFNHTKSRLDL
ncbi:MAG: dTMP kinase, partial [bacterium]